MPTGPPRSQGGGPEAGQTEEGDAAGIVFVLCLWIVYLMSCLSCVYSGERKQRWERVASGMHWERWWEGYCGPNDTITLLGDMVEDYSGPIVTPSPHWAQGGSDQGRGGLGRTTIHHEGEESC